MMSPTSHQAWETFDTIAAQAANPIFGKLQFYVIISSTIDLKLKTLILGLPKETFDY